MKKSNIGIFVLVLILAIMVGGYFYAKSIEKKPAAPLSEQKITVALQSDEYTKESLVDLAEEKGIFKKYNLKVTKLPNTKNISATLKSGSADVSMTAAVVSTLSYLNNQDYVWIDKLTEYPPLDGFIGRQGTISTFTNAGVSSLATSPQAYTEVVAANLKIKDADLNFVVAANGLPQLAMIASGKLDFFVGNIYPEAVQKVVAEKKYQVIKPNILFKNKKVPYGVFTTSKEVKDNSEALSRFVKAINEASEYASQNPNEFKAVVIKDNQITDATAQQVVDSFMLARSKNNTPTQSDLKDVVAVLKGWEPTNPNRNLSGFVVDKFAK